MVSVDQLPHFCWLAHFFFTFSDQLLHNLSLCESLFIGIPRESKKQFPFPFTEVTVVVVVIVQLNVIRVYDAVVFFPFGMRVLMVEVSPFVLFMEIVMEILT